MSLITLDLEEQTSRKLLNINNTLVKFVGIINSHKKTMISKIQNNKHNTFVLNDEMMFALESSKIKCLIQEDSDLETDAYCVSIQRDEENYLLFVHHEFIVSLKLDSITTKSELSKISEKSESIAKEFFICMNSKNS